MVIYNKNKMEKIVKFKKIDDSAVIPTKANSNDACYDVVATSRHDFKDGRIEYGLGFALELPEGTRLDLRARSSIYKTGLILSNCIGTGDEGYTGEYKAIFYHVLPHLLPYRVGERILQIHVEDRHDVKFVETNEIISSDGRGEGGFGSSDAK